MSRFLTIVNGIRTLAAAILQSAGTVDAGKIVATSSNGKLHNSLINWDSPSAIGSEVANTVQGTTLFATSTEPSIDSLPGLLGAIRSAGGISAVGNVVAGGYLFAKGSLYVDATGSSLVAPRVFSVVNMGEGTAAAFQLGSSANQLLSAYGANMSIASYSGFDIFGCRLGNTPPIVLDLSYNTALWDLDGTRKNIVLKTLSGVAKSANYFEIRSASDSLLTQFDSSGRLSVFDTTPSTLPTNGAIVISGGLGAANATIGGAFRHTGSMLGFYNASAIAKPVITGSRSDGTALASLLTQLANLGLITDSTTA